MSQSKESEPNITNLEKVNEIQTGRPSRMPALIFQRCLKGSLWDLGFSCYRFLLSNYTHFNNGYSIQIKGHWLSHTHWRNVARNLKCISKHIICIKKTTPCILYSTELVQNLFAQVWMTWFVINVQWVSQICNRNNNTKLRARSPSNHVQQLDLVYI